MNRNSGLFTGLLVVLAVLGSSTRSGRIPENPDRGGAVLKNAVSIEPAVDGGQKSGPYSPCLEIAKRLRRFTDAAEPIAKWSLPLNCYPGGTRPDSAVQVHARRGVRFAILTAPDPLATHLPLMFDRVVEATQQAAQDDNYSYDSSWLPWETTETPYARLADQEASDISQEIQQNQPGVLVFRFALHKSDDPYSGGLVVFVVGEQPTQGLRDEQFQNAIEWIDRLGGLTDGTLRILGPTFSGSLPSMARNLEPFMSSRNFKIIVSSGSVSSDKGPEWFDNWLRTRQRESGFKTAMETDSVIVNRFCRYLIEQGYNGERIAFLSEDETAFGRVGTSEEREKNGNACSEAINLYYPRDMATLRSAYEKQSVLNPEQNASEGNAPSTTLRGDLSEPMSSNHDTVRSYGGKLTPLSQETVLLHIIGRLKEKEIQFIVLRSTNSLDQVFLSEFLRRSYPEGRVVVDGADLMFTRGAEGRSLRGVMVLSPFPLFTVQTDWTPSLLNTNSGGYRTFGQDTAEGLYIAARELFLDPKLGTEVPIHDYAPPAWLPRNRSDESKRPATWLSVISRRQLWPLAAMNSTTMRHPDRSLVGTIPASTDRGDGKPHGGSEQPLSVPMTMWVFLFMLTAVSALHCYLCRKPSILGAPHARAYFDPIDRRQHPALIALGTWMLIVLAACVATDTGLLSWQWGLTRYDTPLHPAGLLVAMVAVLSLAVSACRWNYRLDPLCTKLICAKLTPVNNTAAWKRRVIRYASIALAVFVATQCALVLNLTPANSIPVYWRSMNLFSGVSPLLPEVLLAAGGYVWVWYSLRGLAHFGDDMPVLPSIDNLPKKNKIPLMPMFSQEKAGDPIRTAALPLTKRYAWSLLTTFVLTAGLASLVLHGPWMRTLGELGYGVFIFVWVCVYIALVLTDTIQIWQSWMDLRELLVYLDRLPLRRTLRELKGLAWGSIWRMTGRVLDERYRVITLQIECLRHLENLLGDPPEGKLQELKMELAECRKKVNEFVDWYVVLNRDERVTNMCRLRDMQAEFAKAAGYVLDCLLLPAWQKDVESLIFAHPKSDSTGDEAGDTEDVATGEIPALVRIAEEFFVLPYLAFIQNIMGRVRTIAMSSLWLFVATTLAVSSYPFDPLNVLGGIFLAVFAVVGSMTVLVYSQMCRDATLSHITNTRPGQLGTEFWTRLLAFGFGPLLGLLTTIFPSITEFCIFVAAAEC